MKSSKLIVFILLFVFAYCSKNEDIVTVAAPYFPKVKTIIANHCLSCHSSAGTWLGRPTAFDSDDEIVTLYANIKAAVADPATITNKRMPQTGSLSSSEIEVIVKWWELGGKITD